MTENTKKDAKKDTRELKIYPAHCKGCGLCVDVCPCGVLELGKEVNDRGLQYVVIRHPEKCTKCGLCFVTCPDSAIEIVEAPEEEK